MPIITISKVEVRSGLYENLPQLSKGELGWALDTRQLYIGNGPISEGAPLVGNTEILTQHSDILSVADRYEYKGSVAGYPHITGVDASNPTTRTLQLKLDESVSVKDFGAVGDGSTDDTTAINRALYELFCRESNEEIRRSLFFPAGIYLVTDVIKVPPYARLYGEGKNSSIIVQNSASPGKVVALSDSKHQIDANLGNSGATFPQFIEMAFMSLRNDTVGSVMDVDLAKNCRFTNVRFDGNRTTTPTTVTSTVSCVNLTSTAVNQTRNIMFDQCDFRQNVFGVLADDDMQSITFNGCTFEKLYKAVKLGENTSGSGSSVLGPRAVRITNSLFDSIYSVGLHVYNISDVISAFNYYKDVANALGGSGNPDTNVIIFGGDNNSSVFDIFDRNDTDAEIYARVSYGTYDAYYLNPGDGIQYGYHRTESGKVLTLSDNTSNANTTITFDAASERGNKIYFTAVRGSVIRHGTMVVTASASGSTISEEYQEDGSDIGLTFTASVSSGTTQLKYTTTSTGNDVTFKYRIERLI